MSVVLTVLLALEICLISRVQAVLQCYECHEVATPQECENLITCGQNEICFTREFRDENTKQGYHLGCEDKDRCDLFKGHPIVGRDNTKRASSHMCYECCGTDNCNSLSCANSTVCADDVNAGIAGSADGKDCRDILSKNKSAKDGIYTIDPGDGQGPFRVFCDMTTDGGGWVVFQRRVDGSEDFHRTWDEYKDGFGCLTDEFYLGNANIYRLTSRGPTTLRVDLEDFSHNTAYATYRNFVLGDIKSNYKLSLGTYSGTAGNSLTHQAGVGFSAKDKDVDTLSGRNCANMYHAGWWYVNCHISNLNGEYNNNKYGQGINWATWKGLNYSLYRTEMKLRTQS